MKNNYDVIVVGAGPAGSVAATTAARKGLDVLLIEKRQEIGVPVRCAEGVIKAGLDEFIEYDPKWVCAEVRRGRIHAPDGNMLCFSQEDTAGYILDRKIFDRSLAKTAAHAGSEVQVKTQATGLIIEDGCVKGITGKCRGQEFEARAKVIIGADGVESKIGRQAGLLGPLRLKDVESCAEFLVSGIDIDPDCLELYFGNKLSPGGYLWVFPKGKNEANIGVANLADRLNGAHPIDYLERYVSEHFPDGKIIQVVSGAVPVCNLPGRLSMSGLLLAGDGARLVDPLLGAGIMNAMISGRMAGNIAANAINAGDVSAKALKTYDHEIRSTIGKAIRRNYRVKEFIVGSSDLQMNLMIAAAKKLNVESIPVSEIFLEVTTNGLPIMKVVRMVN
ncbi:geranylgeranyl reductase [Methanocella paludicola SANAE]|uniref:Digeranylgeranylglycerophospholipid reductase n=1 Tax=Methanocella paludicola (strain DSM 17711 / JCM 13418 / NBRC 101707 / SANAE) TaxID=304371 RepID=D1YYN0_METPS|nr:NAD(P)/FAD-dependent oxidoreductase [Methanocella paludicola]BAI61552.1 geranylgeranyl reductase [Methanocella paludicola SANAE]